MTTTHKGLPVEGYATQSQHNVDLVNSFKRLEEQLLREIDAMHIEAYDQRWLAIAQTDIQKGFMALNRAVFRPTRIELPTDQKEQEGINIDADLIVAAARAAHEANRVYCMTIGDNSQPHWDEAPSWQQESAVDGVKYIIKNPNSTPRDSHENWLSHKRIAGWSYGPKKSPMKKEHPCMVDYDQLPGEQRTKDELFQATVRAVLNLK